MTNDKQKDRLVELLEAYVKSESTDLPAYLLANGVIVPPCKVGQTVYLLQKYYGTYCFNVVEDNVQMIGVTSRGIHIKPRPQQDVYAWQNSFPHQRTSRSEAERRCAGVLSEARPNYEAMAERLSKENDALKQEVKSFTERCIIAEEEKEVMKKRIAELEAERQYHLGQIEAYRFALKRGAE